MQLVTPAKATAVARAGTAKLAAMVRPDGSFVYRYLIDNPDATDAKYGEVRHIGAVFALIDFEREGWPIPGLGAAIDRAAGFMVNRLFQTYGKTDMLCVVDEGYVKLGGSALGVAASLALFARSGDASHLERTVRLARFVELQRLPSGEFVQVVVPGKVSTRHPMRAEEYTGQPILALALAAEATGETRWLDIALDSTRKLAARDHGKTLLVHWMAYALEALIRIHREPWLVDYAARLAGWMLADKAIPLGREATPLACQTEGLLAYARMLDALGEEGDPSLDVVLKRVGNNLRRQLRFFQPDGGFLRSLEVREVRIDYLMHHVIGFLSYARTYARARERRGQEESGEGGRLRKSRNVASLQRTLPVHPPRLRQNETSRRKAASVRSGGCHETVSSSFDGGTGHRDPAAWGGTGRRTLRRGLRRLFGRPIRCV